jgi:dTDP-4-dehydrorhamnose reductase
MLVRVLREREWPVVAYDRKALDLSSAPRIADKISPLAFDAIINAAALTSLDICEQQPKLAYQINTDAVAHLAQICKEKKARFIQISTDYVYDGSSPGLKVENAPLNPQGVYAQSKREAEQQVLNLLGASSLVARVSWLYGPDRPSFVDQLLEKSAAGQPLEAIADKFSSPSYTRDVAEALADLMAGPAEHFGGILNVGNPTPPDVSWHRLAEKALNLAQKAGFALQSHLVTPQPLASMSAFLAPRPIHTASDHSALEKRLGRPMRHWEDALEAYLTEFYGPGKSS